MFILLLSSKNPPGGHVRQEMHVSESSAHCECILLSFHRQLLLPGRGRQSLLPLPQNHLTCGRAAFFSRNLPKLAAASVENVVTALQSHRWTLTVRIFGILFSQRVNKETRQRNRKESGTLTLLLALAELLAEILGHHAGARAVAGMVRVVTWLVVVHLIGRVIWSSRGRRLRQ